MQSKQKLNSHGTYISVELTAENVSLTSSIKEIVNDDPVMIGENSTMRDCDVIVSQESESD